MRKRSWIEGLRLRKRAKSGDGASRGRDEFFQPRLRRLEDRRVLSATVVAVDLGVTPSTPGNGVEIAIVEPLVSDGTGASTDAAAGELNWDSGREPVLPGVIEPVAALEGDGASAAVSSDANLVNNHESLAADISSFHSTEVGTLLVQSPPPTNQRIASNDFSNGRSGTPSPLGSSPVNKSPNVGAVADSGKTIAQVKRNLSVDSTSQPSEELVAADVSLSLTALDAAEPVGTSLDPNGFATAAVEPVGVPSYLADRSDLNGESGESAAAGDAGAPSFPADLKLATSQFSTFAPIGLNGPMLVGGAPANLVIAVDQAEINEAGSVSLSGSFDNPGSSDAHTVLIAWGDGGQTTINLLPGQTSFSATYTYFDDAPTGTPFDINSVNVSVTDQSGDSVSASTSVKVNNVAPSNLAITLTPTVISEGGTVTLGGSFTEIGPLDSQSVEINWGDGSANTVLSLVPGQSSFTTTHTYQDNNPSITPADFYAVSVTVTDDDTGAVTNTTSVQVQNVPPDNLVLSLSDLVINEDGKVTLEGTFDDPGSEDAHELTINWGDGSPPTTILLPVGDREFSITHQYLDDDPTATAFDSYQIQVGLTDDDGGSTSATTQIQVDNVAPQLASLVATTIDENGVTTLTGTIADPGTLDSFTLQVDWGDPLSPNNLETYTFAPGTTSFTLSHQYLDDNPTGTPTDNYSIGLTLTDDDTGQDVQSTSVTVNNVAPVLGNLVATTIDENGVTTLTGTITDPGTLDSFTLQVNWGDPLSPNNLETYTFAPGTTSFTLSHQYLDDNPTGTPTDNYSIGLTLTDDDTGQDVQSTSVTVNNVAPVLGNLVATTIDENGVTTLTGTITDPGTLDSFTLQVDWGDPLSPNNLETYTFAPGTTSFTLSHQYLDDNPTGTPTDNYTIGLTLTDDDTGQDVQSTSVTVNNVAPTIIVPANLTIQENGSLTIEFSDPGTLDSHTVVVDWGDGSPVETITIVPNGPRQVTHQYLDDNPTGTPQDNYTIGIQVTDDDTGIDHQAIVVTVVNVDPLLENLSATTITENGVTTLTGAIIDPGSLDSFTMQVNWGDPLSPNNVETHSFAAGTTSFSLTHQYLDDNPTGTASDNYTISLHVVDDDTGVGTATTPVTVLNADPGLVDIVGSTIDENGIATVTARIVDVGSLDTFTLEVDWNDDNAPQLISISNLNFSDSSGTVGDTQYQWTAATRTIVLTHQYLDDGDVPGDGEPVDVHTVGLRAIDDDTGVGLNQAAVTVRDLPPQVLFASATQINILGQTTLTLNFTDVGTTDAYVIAVDWGDGQPPELISMPAGSTSMTRVHQYFAPPDPANPANDIPINVTVADDDSLTDTQLTFADVPGRNVFSGAVLPLPTGQPLEFPVLQSTASTPARLPPPISSVRTFIDSRSGAETVVGSDRKIILRTVSVEGVESNREFVLPESTLDDLRSLFGRLPDGRYRIYLRQDKIDRLIFDVVIRQGKPVDASEANDGTLDRPPTSNDVPVKPATDETDPKAEQVEDQQQPAADEQPEKVTDWSKPARLARAIQRRAAAC